MEVEQYPLVVSTWPFVEAVRAAWRAVDGGSSAVDSVVEGCSACEELRCDGTGANWNVSKIKWTFQYELSHFILSIIEWKL